MAFKVKTVVIRRKKLGIARKIYWHSKEGINSITLKVKTFSRVISDKKNNSNSVGITGIGVIGVL